MADNKGNSNTVKETPAQKYKRLLQEAEQHKTEAVDSLKKEIQTKIDELNEYGYEYELSEPTPQQSSLLGKSKGRPAGSKNKPAGKKAEGESANFKPELHCKVCGIAGHHTRAHNHHPERFTEAELKDKGIFPPVDTRQQELLPA